MISKKELDNRITSLEDKVEADRTITISYITNLQNQIDKLTARMNHKAVKPQTKKAKQTANKSVKKTSKNTKRGV